MKISTIRPSASAVPKEFSPLHPELTSEKEINKQTDTVSKPDTLSKEGYLENTEIIGILNALKAEFGENMDGVGGKRPLIVSDVVDEEGHQYVNLVQKGGGVLGIALVGYTHILEQMGIRFIRMAGTSAGAINTALFTAVGNELNPKAEAKSGAIIGYLTKLDMFSFVDGHPFAKWLIRNFISDTKFEKRMQNLLVGLTVILALLIFATLLLLGLEKHWGWRYASALTRTSFVMTGLSFLSLVLVGSFIIRMLKRLKESGYGINPGKTFLKWIKDRLDENGTSTIDDLNKKAAKLPPSLKLRNGNPLGNKDLPADVTFITSELVTQNKIEFPKMWTLFRAPEDGSKLHPGEFVRASMSIPFFFESHIITDIPEGNPSVQIAWKTYFGINPDSIPNTVRFIDGGVLSNFPINIFYNPKVAEARLPSFGIDLDDTDPKPENGDDSASWPLGSYIGRMLNTIRYYYDKDFLLKNNVYARGVGKVNLQDKKFNWLDFFLSDQTKLDLFTQGAIAAKEFLMTFDWEDYKLARREMYQTIQAEKAPEQRS